jgi:hypothetical protein
LAAKARRALVHQPAGEGRRHPLQARIADVDGDASERDDPCHVENALLPVLLLGAELSLQDRGSILKTPRLQQLPAAPRLEDVKRPPLTIAPRRRDTVGGVLDGLFDAIKHRHQLAAPRLHEALACEVVRGGAGPGCSLRQLERARVPSGDRLQSALGEIEHECGVRITAVGDRRPGLRQIRMRLL